MNPVVFESMGLAKLRLPLQFVEIELVHGSSHALQE
jgi:hypothetical protein